MSAAAFTRLDRHKKDRPAEPGDGIPVTMCRVFGFPGPRHSPGDCVDALRDRIANLEFQASLNVGTRKALKRTQRCANTY
jgi:hypothetical protein